MNEKEARKRLVYLKCDVVVPCEVAHAVMDSCKAGNYEVADAIPKKYQNRPFPE